MNKRRNPFSKFYRKEQFLKPLEHPVYEFPFYIDIELTNHCNIDCIMCKRQIMTREKGFMSEEMYSKIIDEMSMYDAGLRYCRSGEPTLHPKINNFIEYANEKKVLLFVSTNGFYTKEKMLSILNSKPDIIRFSFQGLNKKEYERFRVPAKYDTVTDNLRFCAEKRDELGWERPYIILSTSILDETEEEVNDFKKKWLQWVDRVEIGKTSFYWVEPGKENSDLKERVRIDPTYLKCLEILTKISINWNGDITACCGDYNGFMVIGNIQDMTIKDAWDSAKEQEFRELVAYDTLHSKLPLCKNCFTGNYKFTVNSV